MVFWARPSARIYGAGDAIGFKTIPTQQHQSWSVVGILFRLNEIGEEVVIWRRTLINVPGKVLMCHTHEENEVYLVTLNNYGKSTFEHALVIYGFAGAVIADFSLTDIVTLSEIEEHSLIDEELLNMPVWHHGVDIYPRFTHERRFQLHLNFKWQVISIDLATGELIKHWP